MRGCLRMKRFEPESESLLAYAQRIKAEDRRRLNALDASQAQAEVDAVLGVSQWTIVNRSQLIWPGDLGDEAEVPAWMSVP